MWKKDAKKGALGKRSFITRDSCSKYASATMSAGVIDRHGGIFAELFTDLTPPTTVQHLQSQITDARAK